jgi:hypothetical protein
MTKRAILLALALLAACGPQQQVAKVEPLPAPVQSAAEFPWPLRTREHVDLWLHSYALLQRDTSQVPFFRRGYREELLAERQRRGVRTDLDANMEKLGQRLATNPALVNGQFLPLYFASLADLRTAVDATLRAEGDPRLAPNPGLAQIVALVAASFPSAQDRQWLDSFVKAVADEDAKFYRGYWTERQAAQAPALGKLDALWRQVYFPKFRGFLNNTRQGLGDFVLSLPLDGEGRTVGGANMLRAITVAFPPDTARAVEAIYVFAHEAIGEVANSAVTDNTTPAEQRNGVSARWTPNAAVRGGEMLLAKIAPELVDGYRRYYLRSAGKSTSGNVAATFTSTFDLPANIVSAIRSQIDVVMGGI